MKYYKEYWTAEEHNEPLVQNNIWTNRNNKIAIEEIATYTPLINPITVETVNTTMHKFINIMAKRKNYRNAFRDNKRLEKRLEMKAMQKENDIRERVFPLGTSPISETNNPYFSATLNASIEETDPLEILLIYNDSGSMSGGHVVSLQVTRITAELKVRVYEAASGSQMKWQKEIPMDRLDICNNNNTIDFEMPTYSGHHLRADVADEVICYIQVLYSGLASNAVKYLYRKHEPNCKRRRVSLETLSLACNQPTEEIHQFALPNEPMLATLNVCTNFVGQPVVESEYTTHRELQLYNTAFKLNECPVPNTENVTAYHIHFEVDAALEFFISEQPQPTFKSRFRSDMKKSSYEIRGKNSTKIQNTYPTVMLKNCDAENRSYYIHCSLCEPDGESSVLKLSPSLLVRPEQEYKHKPIVEAMRPTGEKAFSFELKNYFIVLTTKNRRNVLMSKYEELMKFDLQTEKLNAKQMDFIANKSSSQLRQSGDDFCFSFTLLTKPSNDVNSKFKSLLGPIFSQPFVSEQLKK